jgi:hypothetical protein
MLQNVCFNTEEEMKMHLLKYPMHTHYGPLSLDKSILQWRIALTLLCSDHYIFYNHIYMRWIEKERKRWNFYSFP